MRVAVTVDRYKWEGHAQARSGVALREALDERGRERRAEGASHRALTRPSSAIAPCLSSRRPGGAKVDAPLAGVPKWTLAVRRKSRILLFSLDMEFALHERSTERGTPATACGGGGSRSGAPGGSASCAARAHASS